MTRDTRAAHLAGVSILALAIGYTIYPSDAQACVATRQPVEGPVTSVNVVCDSDGTEVIDTSYSTFLANQLDFTYNGNGNDTFTVSGDVNIQQDTDGESPPLDVFSIDMGAGIDTFTMKSGNFVGQDIEEGTAPAIQLLMGAGNDIVDISAGTFGGSIFAGSGNDTITVSGGTVDGDIYGGGDDDTFNISGGTITGSVFGDDAESIGNDTVTISGGTIGGSVFGGGGIDTVTISGNAQIGVAGEGPDSVGLEDGNDIFRMTGGTLAGAVSGNAGNDSITISGGRVGTFVAGNEGDDTIDISGTAIIGEQVTAGEGNDIVTIRGGTVTTFINGESGNDRITVSGGSVGGDIYGNDGDDTINVSGGTIGGTVFGDGGEGTGNNTIAISGGSITGGVVAGNGNDGVTVSGTAQIGAPGATSVDLGAGDDTFNMSGGTLAGSVDGNAGTDTMTLSGGTVGGDFLGGDGNDTLNVSGGVINGSVIGGAGTDVVTISGGTIAGDVQGETVNLNGGTIGGDITGISSDTLTINAGTNLNLRDGVLFQGTNAVGTITDTDLARASGGNFRSQNFDGFSSLTVSGSSIGFKDGTQTIGNLALLNGSTLHVAGDVSMLAPTDGIILAALVTGTGNVSATNSTISMINNDPTDRFSVGNLTLNGATLGIDINQQAGLGDRFVPAGQFQASGTNTILVNLLGTPVFTGVTIIPIAPVAGEVVPTTGGPSSIFLVGGIPNTPGSLFAYDVITGSNGGIYLRALPSDLVSPQATRVAIDSQPIETVTSAIEQITDDALAFALDFPKGSGRSDAAPGFGVYASGQFAAVSHDGFTVSDGTNSLQGPPFTAHDFSLAGSVELDLAKYYGFDQTYGLNVGLFGGYASSDVTMDSIQGLGSIGNADNKSGMIGTYGLFRTGMSYGLVSATTFIGQTDINNDILDSTGNYDTIGYALTGSVGHIFPLGDKWKFDLRGGALWASFEGDAFTDSQGNEFGKSKVSFGALKFEPGFYGDFALDNGMAISPYARLELQQRIGYSNTASIAGMDFEFDDADFSVALSSGLNLQLSKTTTLSGELKTKFSSDSQSLAGKIGIKAKF